MVWALLPTNYFVVLYVALYYVSPYINVAMDGLDGVGLRRMVVVLGAVFMVWPELVDVCSELVSRQLIGMSTVGMYGSQWGYSIVNFCLMYIIGAYLRRSGALERVSAKAMLLSLVAVVVVLAVWGYADYRIGFDVEPSAWEYCNPLVALEAVLVFALFKRVDMGCIGFVNALAKGAFTVFLFHGFLLGFVDVASFASGSSLLLVLHVVSTSVLIYLACWVAWLAWDALTRPLWARLRPILPADLANLDVEGR